MRPLSIEFNALSLRHAALVLGLHRRIHIFGGAVPLLAATLFGGTACVGGGDGRALGESAEGTSESRQALAAPSEPASDQASDPGWSEEQVAASKSPGPTETVDGTVIVIRSPDGLARAPIPESIRRQLEADLADAWEPDMVYLISPSAMAAIARIEADDASGADDASAYAAMDAVTERDARDASGGSCSNEDRVATKSFQQNANLSTSGNLGAGFSGSFAISGDATATGTLEVGYTALRTRVLWWCVTYGARARHVHAYGNLTTNLGGSANGTLSYSTSWEKEISKPYLGNVAVPLGPLPLVFNFSMPISAGFSLSTTASGSLNYQGANSTAIGSFDYTCTFGGSCSGSSGFSTTGTAAPGTVTAGLSGRADVRFWAEAAFRANLYSDSVTYVQLGVRPKLLGDLWGYYGSNCGDANGDGSNETVNALTFDLDWQAHVTGRVSAANTTLWSSNDLWHSGRKHILFNDMMPLNNNSALSPMLVGAGETPAGRSTSYTPRMRPCWPYSDAVPGTLAWGDGTASNVNMPTPAAHAWASTGTRTLTLSTAGTDAHGRNLGSRTTTRSVSVVNPLPPCTWNGKTYPAGSTIGGLCKLGTCHGGPLAGDACGADLGCDAVCDGGEWVQWL